MDTIEVSDNGSGIAERDWPNIGMRLVFPLAITSEGSISGLKHHTSKLPALSELPHVTTFGFRGEALSSLCALCESVIVITSTKETAPMGAVIKLGRDGRMISNSGRIARPVWCSVVGRKGSVLISAAKRGTTVTLNGLFVPLPVRRKEFERNAKREFAKALTMLHAYALVPASASLVDGRSGVRLKVESLVPGRGGSVIYGI